MFAVSTTERAFKRASSPYDFRSRRLMHRGVRGVRDPWLLVDHRKPPAAMVAACDMIEPRHRAIVDVEGKALFRLTAERKADRGLDGAAMGHRDDVLAGCSALMRSIAPHDAVIQIHELSPPGAGRRSSQTSGCRAGRLARERGAVHPLPFAEMLFGECRLLRASLQALEIRRPRSRPPSDACASDCSKTRPHGAAGSLPTASNTSRSLVSQPRSFWP